MLLTAALWKSIKLCTTHVCIIMSQCRLLQRYENLFYWFISFTDQRVSMPLTAALWKSKNVNFRFKARAVSMPLTAALWKSVVYKLKVLLRNVSMPLTAALWKSWGDTWKLQILYVKVSMPLTAALWKSFFMLAFASLLLASQCRLLQRYENHGMNLIQN